MYKVTEPKELVTFRAERTLVKYVEDLAKKEQRTKSQMLRLIIMKHWDANGGK